jgi:hypothetical protein
MRGRVVFTRSSAAARSVSVIVARESGAAVPCIIAPLLAN